MPATSPGLHANCKGRLCQCCRPGTLQYNMPLQGAIACRTHRTFLEIKLMTRALVLLPHFERTLTVTTTCLGPRCLRIAVCTSPTGLWRALQPMGRDCRKSTTRDVYLCIILLQARPYNIHDHLCPNPNGKHLHIDQAPCLHAIPQNNSDLRARRCRLSACRLAMSEF